MFRLAYTGDKHSGHLNRSTAGDEANPTSSSTPSSRRTSTCVPFTSACAVKGAPDNFRQLTQWQIDTAVGAPVRVTQTFPQKHRPLLVVGGSASASPFPIVAKVRRTPTARACLLQPLSLLATRSVGADAVNNALYAPADMNRPCRDVRRALTAGWKLCRVAPARFSITRYFDDSR